MHAHYSAKHAAKNYTQQYGHFQAETLVVDSCMYVRLAILYYFHANNLDSIGRHHQHSLKHFRQVPEIEGVVRFGRSGQ